jgi:hypothetical protein
VAGQPWPTEQPLEVVLACSQDDQEEMEVVLGEPLPQERSEVMFVDGLPVLNRRRAGQPRVEPWPTVAPTLPLASPGRRGEDRLRLRFHIDASGQTEERILAAIRIDVAFALKAAAAIEHRRAQIAGQLIRAKVDRGRRKAAQAHKA